jgi:1-deoxy-D-xylulose-5-phosphate reductoisomerase
VPCPTGFQVTGLAAGSNTDLLKEQIEEFNPAFIYYCDPGDQTNSEINVLLIWKKAVLPEVDTVVVATPGGAGLGRAGRRTRRQKHCPVQ